MTILARRLPWTMGASVLLLACPPATKRDKPPAAECSKFGETCEFSPGKLGTCVTREGCTQGNCFICQSQH